MWIAGQSEAGVPKSVFTGGHEHLVDVLFAARKAARVTQAQLGARVGKSQTFVSLIERSQRRVDVLEFVAIARALEHDPKKLFARVVNKLPKRFDI